MEGGPASGLVGAVGGGVLAIVQLQLTPQQPQHAAHGHGVHRR